MKLKLIGLISLIGLIGPISALAAINLENIPLPDTTSLNLEEGSQVALTLWQKFNVLVKKLNDWLRDEAGIKLLAILKAIGNLFIIVFKWMIGLLEFLINKL